MNQIEVHGEFIGAASLFDIIHHCYGGNVGPVYRPPQGQYRLASLPFHLPPSHYPRL